MTTLQFPVNPVLNQEYDYPPYKYYWDGVKWKTKGIGYNPVNELRDEIAGSAREAIRRSYQEAGYNLVDGSFELGGTLQNSSDVLLHQLSGKAYSWGETLPKTVPAGSTPETAGGVSLTPWADRTDGQLRSDIGVIIKRFDTVASMIASCTSGVGEQVETVGYHDGLAALYDKPRGGNLYQIVPSGHGVADGGSLIQLGSGLMAQGLFPDGLWIEQFGAKAFDAAFDSHSAIQNCLKFSVSDSVKAVNAGDGDFYYSTTLLYSHLNGICPAIKGRGSASTKFIKTTNIGAEISTGDVVDAYIAQYYRGVAAYCYRANITGIKFSASSGVTIANGLHYKLSALFELDDVDINNTGVGYYSYDTWMSKANRVNVHYCATGFKVEQIGTSFNLSNVWVEWCSDKPYDMSGVVYSEWDNCGADHVYDSSAPLVNKTAYTFTNCDGIVLNSCSAEDVHQLISANNSRLKVNGFRCGSIKLGASQRLFEWLNNSAVELDTCSTSAAGATSAITAQYYDGTSYASYKNCKWQIANSGVPSSPHARNSAISTNMTCNMSGLQSIFVTVNPNTGSYVGMAALKSGSGISFVSAHLYGEDNRIVFASQFFAYANISTNPASPTVLGTLTTQGGVASTNLVGYIVTDGSGNNTLAVRFSGSRASAKIGFVYSAEMVW